MARAYNRSDSSGGMTLSWFRFWEIDSVMTRARAFLQKKTWYEWQMDGKDCKTHRFGFGDKIREILAILCFFNKIWITFTQARVRFVGWYILSLQAKICIDRNKEGIEVSISEKISQWLPKKHQDYIPTVDVRGVAANSQTYFYPVEGKPGRELHILPLLYPLLQSDRVLDRNAWATRDVSIHEPYEEMMDNGPEKESQLS